MRRERTSIVTHTLRGRVLDVTTQVLRRATRIGSQSSSMGLPDAFGHHPITSHIGDAVRRRLPRVLGCRTAVQQRLTRFT